MILLFDVGNTNITFAISKGDVIDQFYRINTEPKKTADEYYLALKGFFDKIEDIKQVAISSVVPRLTATLTTLAKKYFNVLPLIVGQGIKTGIQIRTDNPKEVGADLICGAVAASMKDDKAKLIIDLGTATKYIYVRDKTLFGVIITPGVRISIKALVGNTALLPDIDLQVPKKVLGTNSITCMQSGVTYGVASQIDGLIERIFEEVKEPFDVILTGGLSSLIAPLCKNPLVREPKLVLEGLLHIYYKNSLLESK